VGLHLAEPWRVVLTGRPNVGKSSLINALLGFERCIVHAAPGTTRDVVTAHTALDGWPVELADTAGLRDSTDDIESAGVQRARQQLRQADLIVLVFDVSAGWTGEDEDLLAAWPGAVVVHNKCDLPAAPPQDRPPGLMVSATQGGGLDLLVRELARRLVRQPPRPGTAVLFTEPQVRAVVAAQSALAAGNEREALQVLNALLAPRGHGL
jgi:tRNA modification GTPase